MKSGVAVIQMTSSQHVDVSLKRAESLILEAAQADVGAIFLPENFAALASPEPLVVGAAETNVDGPVRQFLSEMASRTGAWIFAGTLPIATRPDGKKTSPGRVRAASLVIDDTGVEVARYDKTHMFDVDVADNQKRYLESETFEPGDECVVVDSPVGRVGLSVCYDVRFPEFFRKLFLEAADIIAVPSAFTRVTGAAHFEVLLRARAIENTCYIIAACQTGIHDSGRQTWGHSTIIDPWGEVLDVLPDEEGVILASLDLSRLETIRTDMPFASQARFLSQES